MNQSYEYWEKQFLTDIAIEYAFNGKHYISFIERLLLKNIHLNNSELLEKIDQDQGGNNYFPDNMIADSWNKVIYPTLKNEEFSGERSIENARKWLRFEIFPEYIKTKNPRSLIELWQELWNKAEENIKMSIELYANTIKLEEFGFKTKNFNREPKPKLPSFPINSKVFYRLNLDNSTYLILIEKDTSGNIYCLVPSFFSTELPLNGGEVLLPKDYQNDPFEIIGEPGYEEIIGVFSKDKPKFNLEWLPNSEAEPLKLETQHLGDLIAHINSNNCEIMKYKYLITH